MFSTLFTLMIQSNFHTKKYKCVVQGGSRQNNTGWALCSNDDVIMLMTSLLLFNPAKHWVGRGPPGPPARYLPGCKKQSMYERDGQSVSVYQAFILLESRPFFCAACVGGRVGPCAGIWPIPSTCKELYYNSFGILFLRLLICLSCAVRKLQPSSKDACTYEYVTTKGLKEYFCVVMLLWPMPVVTTTIVVRKYCTYFYK